MLGYAVCLSLCGLSDTQEGEPCQTLPVCISQCRDGDPAGCQSLGKILRQTQVPKQLKKGLGVLARACKTTDAACLQHAMVLFERAANEKQRLKGLGKLRDLCTEKPSSHACEVLAAVLETHGGAFAAAAITEARSLLSRACDSHNAEACFGLARFHERHRPHPDVRDADVRDTDVTDIERHQAHADTIDALFSRACNGGVTAACEAQADKYPPEGWNPSLARRMAHQFVDECLLRPGHSQRQIWESSSTNRTFTVQRGSNPREDLLANAVSEAIAAFPLAMVGFQGGHRVESRLHELWVPMGKAQVAHLTVEIEMWDPKTGHFECQAHMEIDVPNTDLQDRSTAAPADDDCRVPTKAIIDGARELASLFAGTPWVDHVNRAQGRLPRVRLRKWHNQSSSPIDRHQGLSTLESQLTESGRLTLLSRDADTTSKKQIADAVAVVDTYEVGDDFHELPLRRFQAALALVNPRTAEVIWSVERPLHMCMLPSSTSPSVSGREMAQWMSQLVAEAATSLETSALVECEQSAFPEISGKCSYDPPTVRLASLVNKTDEHLHLTIPARTALARNGRFVLLADGNIQDALDAELALADEQTNIGSAMATQRGADLVMSWHLSSMWDQNGPGFIKYYRLWGELVNASSADKLWIGDREAQIWWEQQPLPFGQSDAPADEPSQAGESSQASESSQAPLAELIDYPAWLLRGSGAAYDFDDQPVIHGVGVVKGINSPELAHTTANNLAMAEVAKVCQVLMATVLRNYAKDFHLPEGHEAHMKLAAETLTSSVLADAQVNETWWSPNGDVYALGYLRLAWMSASLSKNPTLTGDMRRYVLDHLESIHRDLASAVNVP